MLTRIYFPLIVLTAFSFFGDALAQDDPRDRISDLLSNILESQKTGISIPWSNSATGNNGKITITKTFILGRDTNCRDYTRTTNFSNGGGFEVKGTGCRDYTGKWNLEEGALKEIKSAKVLPPKEKTPPVSEPPPLSKRPPKKTAKLSPKKQEKTQPAPPSVKKPSVEIKELEKDPILLGGTIPSQSDDYL